MKPKFKKGDLLQGLSGVSSWYACVVHRAKCSGVFYEVRWIYVGSTHYSRWLLEKPQKELEQFFSLSDLTPAKFDLLWNIAEPVK